MKPVAIAAAGALGLARGPGAPGVGVRVRAEIGRTVRLALPIASAHLALKVMVLVQLALAGRISVEALAAVSLGDALAFAILCPAMGVAIALEPIVAQARGAGDTGRQAIALPVGLLVVTLIACPLLALVYASGWMLGAFGVEEAVAVEVRRYLAASLPGLFGLVIFLAGKADLEARGETRPVVRAVVAANLLNGVAGAYLVFGDNALAACSLPPLGFQGCGVVGLGLASSLCHGLLAALVLLAPRRDPRPRRPPDGAARRVLAWQLVRLGWPTGLMMLAEIGAFGLGTLLVARFGASASAGHQIALTLSNTTYMAMVGLGTATSVRVGQAVGAGDRAAAQRAGMIGIGVGVAVMAACGLAFLAGAEPLVACFSADANVAAIAIPIVQVVAAYQLVDAIQSVGAGALRGAGDTRFACGAMMIGHWLIGLPLGTFLAFATGLGVAGLWIGFAGGLLAVASAVVLRFRLLSSRPIRAI